MTKYIGVDLGTANTLVYCKGKGIVLSEPSVVAVHKRSGAILAVGEAAKEMIGKTPEDVAVVRPLKGGVIADFDAAQAMLLLGKNGISGRIYVIGSGKAEPLKEYIEQLNESVRLQNGSTGELGFGDIPYGEKQVMHLEADISLLKADTSFEPQTDFTEGIQKTVEHLLKDRH